MNLILLKMRNQTEQTANRYRIWGNFEQHSTPSLSFYRSHAQFVLLFKRDFVFQWTFIENGAMYGEKKRNISFPFIKFIVSSKILFQASTLHIVRKIIHMCEMTY